ncbi:MAG: methylated-DNA--[protein]-cysteine S-methyltransferase [Lachnospiraceae bacterium]|nr:methylated-DNA--[protein]-cysteine S-methyltransferase [Lachnospiraceae bacterium]
MKHIAHYNTPIGMMCMESDGTALTALYVDRSYAQYHEDSEDAIMKQAYQQLMEYFDGKRKEFDVPIHLEGTDFQKKVWNALCTIPYGSTCSYADIARKIGNPKAYRPVGGANNKNPIMIIVPCHRVIGANGRIIGYGPGIDIKKKLINLEKQMQKQEQK